MFYQEFKIATTAEKFVKTWNEIWNLKASEWKKWGFNTGSDQTVKLKSFYGDK